MAFEEQIFEGCLDGLLGVLGPVKHLADVDGIFWAVVVQAVES